eukprot:TRINITY_DN12477_c0_g1_i1.p1 TRINITY_DN12477_c0_g1~~TRINITY_DN12477_c0_g1_i1.p1  ORF type:complete len:248 (-),score=34.20 TRINITY_DN12477_c0_g1_i1:225-968(-)
MAEGHEFQFLGINLTCLVKPLLRMELPPLPCILSLASLAVGCAIILGSTIIKLPQILVIFRARSTEGLSRASFEMELVGYSVALAYCRFKNVPFSAYGELLFLWLQAIILVILLYIYGDTKFGPATLGKVLLYLGILPVLFGGVLEATVFEALYAGQTALFTLARIPQIWMNIESGSTGKLSLTTAVLNFGGCIARIFTSIQERTPINMLVGSILGLLSHGTLLLQILFYGGRNRKQALKEAGLKTE